MKRTVILNILFYKKRNVYFITVTQYLYKMDAVYFKI